MRLSRQAEKLQVPTAAALSHSGGLGKEVVSPSPLRELGGAAGGGVHSRHACRLPDSKHSATPYPALTSPALGQPLPLPSLALSAMCSPFKEVPSLHQGTLTAQPSEGLAGELGGILMDACLPPLPLSEGPASCLLTHLCPSALAHT